MTDKNFNLNYQVTGAERKRLVNAISTITGAASEYLGAPTFSYRVDYFTIDKNGVISFGDSADSEEIENLVEKLAAQGFEVAEPENEADGLTISVPVDKVAVGNLTRLLDAKGALIQKALGISALPIELHEDRVSFPWFETLPDADEVKAYSHLITALCEMSVNQKRITSKEKDVDNDKYAFRCFLLRLGFIGAEFKTERKILLRNLAGSSAFKSGQPKEVEV